MPRPRTDNVKLQVWIPRAVHERMLEKVPELKDYTGKRTLAYGRIGKYITKLIVEDLQRR